MSIISMPCSSWTRPPIVLNDVLALGEADFLALEVRHFVDGVVGVDHHNTAFVDMRCPDQAGAADVGLNVDSRVAASVAHEVVEVVDVVRVPSRSPGWNEGTCTLRRSS